MVGLFITLGAVALVAILAMLWLLVLRPCNPINGHDPMHRWESSGLRRTAGERWRWDKEHTLYRCRRCGTRRWVKSTDWDRSKGRSGLLVHQI